MIKFSEQKLLQYFEIFQNISFWNKKSYLQENVGTNNRCVNSLTHSITLAANSKASFYSAYWRPVKLSGSYWIHLQISN